MTGFFGGASMIFVASTTTQTAHGFSFTSIDVKICHWQFKGKAVLIVNTASMCGFTSQYSGLQDLWTAIVIAGLLFWGCQVMILAGKS